jgi:hypothetical protein
VLDIFWYLEQIEKSGLTKNIGAALDNAEQALGAAELAVKAAHVNERRIQREYDAVTKQLKGGVAKGKRRALQQRQRKLKADLGAAKKHTASMQRTLGQLQHNKLHDLVVRLRDPRAKKLRSALRDLEAAERKLREFFKKNPSAKVAGRYLSVVGIASEGATMSAWTAELLANLLRELRRPPPGCAQLFDPLPPSVVDGASAIASAAAKPVFEPLVTPVADLPPAVTGGKLPRVARSLRSQLADIAAHLPAVHAGLLKRNRSKAARAALTRTLPRLSSLLTSVGSLRPKLAGALRLEPRVVSAADLSKYRPQAPSRAALRLLGQGDAPRWLRNGFKQLYRDGSRPTGLQDPLATIADPALGQLERDAAKALRSLD